MSDFFAQLGSNIRFPDANINGGGPLPTSLSGPAGVNGDPDGKINFNSELLSGIAPYAYGPGEGRMGADRNYQQIPHRIQKIIPKLYLPYADVENTQSCVALSHAVDMGDVAFILQSSRVQGQLYDNHALRDASIANQQLPSHTAFINISTVNYLLAGLQRLTKDTPKNATWSMLARDLGYRYKRGHPRADMLQLVSSRFVPFGICAGSEHQGGKHETGLAPVQAAVNHITTLTIDGQNRDLVNLWRNIDISAGDQLIFKLEWLPTHSYTLNHYYKGVVRQTFVKPMSCWQLIPDTFRMQSPEAPLGLKPWAYDYRINGYWRIGQCFQHRGSFEADPGNIFHDTSFLRGQLLQVTFAPVWVQCQPLNTVDDATAAPEHSMMAQPKNRDHEPLKHAVSGVKRSWAESFRAPEKTNQPSHFPQYAPNPGPFKLGVRWSLGTQQHTSRLANLLVTPSAPSVLHVAGVLQTAGTSRLAAVGMKPPSLADTAIDPAVRHSLALAAPTRLPVVPDTPVRMDSAVAPAPAKPLPPITKPAEHSQKPAAPPAAGFSTADKTKTASLPAVASLQTLTDDLGKLGSRTNGNVIKVNRVAGKGKQKAARDSGEPASSP